MNRIPPAVFVVAAIVFLGLAIWSANARNWSGLIAGIVLAVLCIAALVRRRMVT